jgi:hypothetical protein
LACAPYANLAGEMDGLVDGRAALVTGLLDMVYPLVSDLN